MSLRLCKILEQFATFRLFSGHLESVLGPVYTYPDIFENGYFFLRI